jgi:hypothetical protein
MLKMVGRKGTTLAKRKAQPWQNLFLINWMFQIEYFSLHPQFARRCHT